MSFLRTLFSKKDSSTPARVFLTNTLTGNKEIFIPIKPGQVLLYSCGPTVYNTAHIGNLRSYVFSDTLARTLAYAGYRVHRVINITDVGHLVSDADDGEDKMAVGARREQTSPEAIAERYTKQFKKDIAALGIDVDAIQFPQATSYIKEQIALANTLEEKGFTYKINDGLYFDTSKFAGYGKLGHIDVDAQQEGARVAPVVGKRNGADFALWRAAKPEDLQKWDSPWGEGNPGWHLECSAMIRAKLGPEIDIHTGGEDHIAVHHNNEIAQSEAANGRPLAHYWMHVAFLTMNGEKISKSTGNVAYVEDISAQMHLQPLALRYFFLQAHYRTQLSFTWDALAAAHSALTRLWSHARATASEAKGKGAHSDALDRFLVAMRDDLATPQALGILWETLRDEEYTAEEKWQLIQTAEAHLGLQLTEPPAAETTQIPVSEAPESIQELVQERETARAQKDFARADELRDELTHRGYKVIDGPDGPLLEHGTL